MQRSPPAWLAKAEAIAREAHRGQFRRDGTTPYIAHPADVAARLAGDPVAQAVGWLHDVLEDTPETSASLRRRGIPDRIIACVKRLTKRAGMDYDHYLDAIRRDPLARRVKMADMRSNLEDHPSEKQIKKYTDGLARLS